MAADEGMNGLLFVGHVGKLIKVAAVSEYAFKVRGQAYGNYVGLCPDTL